MSGSTRDSVATRTLLARIAAGSTGLLSRGDDADQLAVYLLEGEIVAATAASDPQLLVRGFLQHEVLDDRTARLLQSHLQDGREIFGELLDLGLDDVLDSVVAERFTQNLCDFVSGQGPVVFQSLPAVFVDSVQIGHDTEELVAEVCDACDRVAGLDPDQLLVKGDGDPGEDADATAVAELMGTDPMSIGDLVTALPFERTRARLVVADLLERGVVAPPPPPVKPFTEDEQAAIAATALEEDDTDLGARMTPPPAPPSSENGVPKSLESWLSDSEGATGADDLDFFSDHDTNRGAEGDGRFKTDTHHLDKVEVGTMSGEHARGTPAEAPHAGFGAPVLAEADARAKIRVANDVLSAVSAAFDIAEGTGRGRAALQLLVDGGPSQFAPLLQDLALSEHGALPPAGVIANLRGRPPTEHRRLLNEALVDLIDRALSNAADELPEEQLDDVLSAIAGYRQRLGL